MTLYNEVLPKKIDVTTFPLPDTQASYIMYFTCGQHTTPSTHEYQLLLTNKSQNDSEHGSSREGDGHVQLQHVEEIHNEKEDLVV